MTSTEYKKIDFERYQTVYAQKEGAVAAPTAGLHFTHEILQKLENQGTNHCFITLNVGLLIVSSIPKALANPLVNIVFPDPNSPIKQITMLGHFSLSMFSAKRRVSSTLLDVNL